MLSYAGIKEAFYTVVIPFGLIVIAIIIKGF